MPKKIACHNFLLECLGKTGYNSISCEECWKQVMATYSVNYYKLEGQANAKN